jgi:hypothetical protein
MSWIKPKNNERAEQPPAQGPQKAGGFGFAKFIN